MLNLTLKIYIYIYLYIYIFMSIDKCLSKSRYAQDPNYECRPVSGRWLPKKNLKRQLAVPRVNNPFMEWLSINRQDLKRQYPTLNPAQLARQAGAIWNQLPPEERREWKTHVEHLKVVYHTEVARLRQQGLPLSTLTRRRQASGVTDYTQWIHAWAQANPKPPQMSRQDRFKQKKQAWTLEKADAGVSNRKPGSDLATAQRLTPIPAPISQPHRRYKSIPVKPTTPVKVAPRQPEPEPQAVQEWEGAVPPQEVD